VTRRRGAVFSFLAVIATGMFYATFQGWGYSRNLSGSAGTIRYHAGKSSLSTLREPACSAQGCHAISAHRKRIPSSAFLNMHESMVSCLGCHGRDPEHRWTAAGTEGKTGFRIGYSPVPEVSPGGRRHGANGTPAPCRYCHSMEGRRSLAAAGVKGLRDGFEDPIVLRMIEGGGRKWLPDDMR
jgi:hypothetical protein